MAVLRKFSHEEPQLSDVVSAVFRHRLRNIRSRVGLHLWSSILGAPTPGHKTENTSIIQMLD